MGKIEEESMASSEELARFIVESVGGADNVESANHCMTRLRIKLKDDAKANRGALDAHDGIISTQVAEGKLQVIIGTQVGEVYQQFARITGPSADTEPEPEPEEKGSLLNRFAALITKIVVPSLGVLCACGIIAGINSILLATGVIATGDGANVLFSNLGNACLTFFPVVLGYTSAVAFGMDPFVGMILGAFLIFPGVVDSLASGDPIFTLLDGTPFAMPVYKTFFGIPIVFPATGYTSTVIPLTLLTWLASKVERWLKAHLPAVTRQFMVPFVTILVAGILGVLAIGPVSIMIQNALQAGLNALIGTSRLLAYAVITLIYQPLVIFGLHWPLITLGLMEFGAGGSTLIVAAIFPASFTHMAACLAVFLRSKSARVRNVALPAFLSACFCIIEPSIYGVTLPVKKRFGYCMAGGLVGGLIIALTNSQMFAISMGVTGFMSFVDPAGGGFMGLVWCAVACLAAMVVTFTLTWLSYKPSEDDLGETKGADKPKGASRTIADTSYNKEVIGSPVHGTVSSLATMPDEAFANGSLGKGVSIDPTGGMVVAPCDGVVSAIFPTGHALGITSLGGAEILIHVGTNTFNAPEGAFEKHVAQGDAVKAGDLLVSFDAQALREAGCDVRTAVVVSNSADYLDVVSFGEGEVECGDALLATMTSERVDECGSVVPAVAGRVA